MLGKLYFYQRNHTKNCNGGRCKEGCEYQKIDVAVREATKDFAEKTGMNPEFVIIRLDEYEQGGKYGITVRKVTKFCPPSHFILFPPFVRNQARTFSGVRKACT